MLLIDGYNALHQFFRGRTIAPETMPSRRDEFVEALQIYSVRRRKNIVVFFDGSRSDPPIPIRPQIVRGRLAVLTTPRGVTADDAIIEKIEETRDRRSIKIVTSDRVILNVAERRRIDSQTSEDFIRELERFLDSSRSIYDKEKLQGISEGEAEYWLKEFGLEGDKLDELIE
jgi:predicted RNA-binding protein with PIN domain